ncbi:MAG: hypothetical protein KBD00_05880 [Candidatus Peribacteraceae bacterium]|nr:hypothetical protein [Candidatus Peribacteraceae bacterium]
MFHKFIRGLKAMELEDQIFHVAVLLCGIGVFLPWFGGQWYGTNESWNGLNFYTGYTGGIILLIQVFLLVLLVSPMLGGPVIVKRSSKTLVRLVLSGATFLSLLNAFGVLIRVTFEISGPDIRFGIYVSIISSLVALFYAALRYQMQQRLKSEGHFRHPDEPSATAHSHHHENERVPLAPPPPPPPPLSVEDHHPYSS